MLRSTANFQERLLVFNVCAGANATRIGWNHGGALFLEAAFCVYVLWHQLEYCSKIVFLGL